MQVITSDNHLKIDFLSQVNDNEIIAGEMQAELNDLSSDIELKTKLIEQLELSQNRLKIMKQHYEEKLNVLNSKILNTQQERDQVLANMEAGNLILFFNKSACIETICY